MIYNNYNKMMAVQSDTGTSLEAPMANCIYDILYEIDYFKLNEHLLMKQFVEGDIFGRMNIAALYLGESQETVIMLHHHDAVDIFEYNSDLALSNEIKDSLKTKKLNEEVRKDLDDDDWWFGRGSADMKSGAAVQIEVLSSLIKKEFRGSILLLSVCDEENLSAGMREAIKLIKKLHQQYGLDYKAIINSEPTEENLIYEGTVGKMMPVCYVRGRKSHIGDVYSGFNPMSILSRLHGKVELNPLFTDHYEGEVSPAPTWVHYRDRKATYDASMPESSAAYFSILSLEKSPKTNMDDLKSLAIEAFDEAIQQYESCIMSVNKHSKEKIIPMKVRNRVLTFGELKKQLLDNSFEYWRSSPRYLNDLNIRICNGELSLPEATLEFIEYSVGFLDHMDPIVVIGLSGPYYPAASNYQLNSELKFLDMINKVSKAYGREYHSKKYFMGICDFSYVNFLINDESRRMIEENLIGWGTLYEIPFDEMMFKIPMINIGPYGKDLHKITERVHSRCFIELPQIIEKFIYEIYT